MNRCPKLTLTIECDLHALSEANHGIAAAMNQPESHTDDEMEGLYTASRILADLIAAYTNTLGDDVVLARIKVAA